VSAAPGSNGTSGSGGPGTGMRRAGGPPLILFILGLGGVVLGAFVILAQLLGANGGGGSADGGRPPGATPTMGTTGDATARTVVLVTNALAAESLQAIVPQSPYRPGESPALVNVPRGLLQVVLPDEPSGGYIVIYELSSPAEAEAVGRDFAAYLASGTGAIQYPRDTQFVLRRVGQTLVFFPWSAEASTDERVPQIAVALGTVGEAIPVG